MITGIFATLLLTLYTRLEIKAKKQNKTIEKLHHEIGMANESIKYSEYRASRRPETIMDWAEKRHKRLHFVEKGHLRIPINVKQRNV